MSHRPSNHRILGVLAALVASAAMAQPTNDLCTSAETIAVAAPGVVTTSGVALIQGSAAGLEAPFSCFTTSKNSVWYRFDAPAYGSYRVDTCNGSTNYDTVIQMYAGNDCGGLTTIGTNACNDQGGSTCTPSNSSALTLTLAPGRYYVQVAAYTSVTIGATTSTALNVSYTVPAPPQTPNDVCSGATQLTPSATAGTVVSAPQVNAFTTGAFVETAQQCVATARNDLWYSFVPAVSGPHRVDTCGASNYDTTLALFTGSCGALVPVSGACNNDGSCTPSTASALTANLVAGVRYYAQVGANASPVSTSTSGLNVTRFDAHPLDQCSVDSPQLQLGRSVTALWATPDAGFAPALDDARLAGAACFSNTAQTDAGIGQTTTTASGRDIAYQFRAPTSGRYSFRVWTPTVTSNAVLYQIGRAHV